MRKLIYLFVAIGVLSSCGDSRDGDEEDVNTQVSQETTASDAFYNHIYAIANEEVNDAEDEEFSAVSNKTSEVDPCADVEYYLSNDKSYIENLTIKYDDATCSYQGRSRLGKIHIHLTGRLNAIGTVMTVTLEDFYVANHKVEGTQVSTNTGLTLNYEWLIEQSISNGKVTLPNGDFLTWDSKKEITLDLINRQIIYTGSGAGTTSKGFSYSMTINDPLKMDFDCQYVQEGTITVKADGITDQTIDYGAGTCDSKATVYSGVHAIDIVLD